MKFNSEIPNQKPRLYLKTLHIPTRIDVKILREIKTQDKLETPKMNVAWRRRLLHPLPGRFDTYLCTENVDELKCKIGVVFLFAAPV